MNELAHAARPLALAGKRLAALAWGREGAPVWLALHGWLDNAASFSRLAPRLAREMDVRIVALDFRGHGHSEHAPPGGDYALWDYVFDVLDALDALAIERATLLAHSMGAAVACVLAATLPERVERLLLVDGLGALNTEARESAAQLRKGLLAHRRTSSRLPRYADMDAAVAARVAGGVTPVGRIAIYPVVERNTRATAEGQVEMRTDPRLLKPSLVRFTPEQVLALLGEIQAPVLLVEGDRGILGQRRWSQEARQAVARLTREVLPGGHHLHLEPDSVEAVAGVIAAYCTTTAARSRSVE